jgi:LuxR family maltose regulon positive regulatory protein
MLPSFLKTKLIVPHHQRNKLPRPHLIEWLEAQHDKRLILISAPAGFGKTTLLSDFIEDTNIEAAWYQLEATDNDPSTFVSYLVESLRYLHQKKNPSSNYLLGEATLALLDDVDNEKIFLQRLLTVMINELIEVVEDNWMVVLDDYHFITSPAVNQFVDYLLENAPPGLQLIISSRVEPPLRLARLRARGLLSELRANELRFSAKETRTWINQQLPGLITDENIQILNEKTEGWAAALQIVLSSLSGQDPQSANQFIANISGTQRFIFDYLAEEVFRRLTPGQQDFLLTTSILEKIDVSVCSSVLGSENTQEVLEDLEAANLILTSSTEQHKWYRYHQLFREFLLGKIRQEQPQTLFELEQKAGAYYESQGEWEQAFSHYIQAELFEKAAKVLEIFASDFVERGRVEALNRYLNMLSDPVLQTHPELLLQRGNVLRRLGQVGVAIASFEDARTAFTKYGDHAGVCRVLTYLSGINYSQGFYRQAQAQASHALAQATADDHAERALALMALSRSEGFLAGMDRGRSLAEQAVEEARKAGEAVSAPMRANLLQSLGQICWWYGDPQATVRYCKEALQAIPDQLSPIVAKAYIGMVPPYLYWRELGIALQYAEKGLEIAQTLHLVDLLPSAYAALGNVLTRLGEPSRAESSLRQAMETAQRLGLASYERVMATGFLAYNLTEQGRLDEALQLAEGALWSYTGYPDTYDVYVCRSVLADIAIEKGNLSEAEHLFEELLSIGQKHQFRIPLAMVYFGLAYIYLNTGREENGIEFALESLTLIEPSRALQLYLDQGERSRVVCNAVIQQVENNPFIKRVLEYIPEDQDAPLQITVVDKKAVVVKTLGQLQVFVNGDEITQAQWISTKARDLLAYFITFRRERIIVDRVFDAVWDVQSGRGKTAFHTALSRLRKALRTEDQNLKFILVETGEYWLDTARFSVDVDEFDAALAKARSTKQADRGSKWYQRAIDLYRGEYLENLYYDWIFPERRRINQAYLSALCSLAGIHYSGDQHLQAIETLQRAISIDPYLEDAHCKLMKSYSKLDNRVAVVRQYQQIEQLLMDELGVEPLPSTQSLYQQLIR